jgi:hypothetical protein
VALTTRYQAEQLHVMGEKGAKRIFRWLNSTGRFSMSHTAYDLDPASGLPTDHCRIETMDGGYETFDLFGTLMSEKAQTGDRLLVECKEYSSSGNQGKLYREYLVVCYSAFHRRWKVAEQEPSLQFMWATSHPFSVSDWSQLKKWEMIRDACEENDLKPLLGGEAFDNDVGRALAQRLWLSVVNDRVDEMMMGNDLLGALRSEMIKMGQS